MIYYIKYRLITGLGQPEHEETFDTIAERYQCFLRVSGAGYEITEFGQRGK